MNEEKLEENLPKVMIDFIQYLKNQMKSQNTIDGYVADIDLFLRYMLHKKERTKKKIDYIDISNVSKNFIREITFKDLNDFITYCREGREKNNNKPHAISRKHSSLKCFFGYLYRFNIVDENIASSLEKIKIPERIPKYFNEEETKKILESINKDTRNYKRDCCILKILFNTGIRLSELINIKLTSIKGNELTVIGKGEKERKVYLGEGTLKAIEDYLEVRNKLDIEEEDRYYLFISERRKKMSKRGIEKLVKIHYEDAGFTDGKYTVHTARHSFVTRMCKRNVDIRKIAKMVGHTNISTTMLYTHIEDKETKEAMENNEV